MRSGKNSGGSGSLCSNFLNAGKKKETLTNLLLQLDNLFELIFYVQDQLHVYCIGEFYYALIPLFAIIKKFMSHVATVSTLVPYKQCVITWSMLYFVL